MEKNPLASKLLKKKIYPLIRYNHETGETEVSTYEVFESKNVTANDDITKFILSYTVHIGLQEDNNWLAFNNANDAHSKRKELDNAENVSNINLSTIIGKVDGK